MPILRRNTHSRKAREAQWDRMERVGAAFPGPSQAVFRLNSGEEVTKLATLPIRTVDFLKDVCH